jgi:Na+-transporting NADH:ubiquinone oxidoreductase subunit NqrF
MATLETVDLGAFSEMSVTIIMEDGEDEKKFCKKGEKIVSALKRSLGKGAKISSRCGGGIVSVMVKVPYADGKLAKLKISKLQGKYFPESC